MLKEMAVGTFAAALSLLLPLTNPFPDCINKGILWLTDNLDFLIILCIHPHLCLHYSQRGVVVVHCCRCLLDVADQSIVHMPLTTAAAVVGIAKIYFHGEESRGIEMDCGETAK